jgi:triosephosphate isomerase (TIM)
MALRKMVAGNWKMNGSLAALSELSAVGEAAKSHTGVDVVICPPSTLIAPAKARAALLMIGGQDCHWNESGARTGCLSPAMLREAGASIVIVGHSERRADQHETSAEICQKALAAIAAGLQVIVCVGETEAERDAGRAVSTVTAQIAASVPHSGSSEALVVAYEPVWAIGTGRTPSLEDVEEMHSAIRKKLIDVLGGAGHGVRILYGGSVKASNAEALLQVPDVDGALVGGASLLAADFIPIIVAANGKKS